MVAPARPSSSFLPAAHAWLTAAALAALLAALAAPAAAAEGDAGSAPAVPTELAPAQETLEEVFITAPEPRYVAPTRRDRIGRVWVPVFINEQGPFRLVLDSGATNSAVIPRVAQRLGLPTDQSPPVLMRGVTGSAVTPTIRVRSLSVGDLEVGSSTLPVVPDVFGGAEGLLGTDGMADKRIYIDFRHDFVNISRSRNRRAESGFSTVPLLADAGRLLVVQATVGSIKVRAIIDTGAQASIGNEALRDALDRRRRRQAPSIDLVTGATGDTQRGEGLPVSPINIGNMQILNAHITFGEMHIFSHWNISDEPTLLVGMDVLGLVDTLVIDYRRRELQIKPRYSAPPLFGPAS